MRIMYAKVFTPYKKKLAGFTCVQWVVSCGCWSIRQMPSGKPVDPGMDVRVNHNPVD